VRQSLPPSKVYVYLLSTVAIVCQCQALQRFQCLTSLLSSISRLAGLSLARSQHASNILLFLSNHQTYLFLPLINQLSIMNEARRLPEQQQK
jgi:hypothetical protein